MTRTTNNQQHVLRVKQDLLSEKNCVKQKVPKQKNCPEQQLAIFTNSYPEKQFAKTLLGTKSCKIWRRKAIQNGKLRKNCPEQQVVKKLSGTRMCKSIVWNDNLQKVIRKKNLKKWHRTTTWKEKIGNNTLQKKCIRNKNLWKKVVLNSNMQKCYLARLFVKESFQEQQLHQVSYANSALFSQNKDPEFWVLGGQEVWRRKRRKIFGEEKYFFEDEKKMGGYLEQEITFGGGEE